MLCELFQCGAEDLTVVEGQVIGVQDLPVPVQKDAAAAGADGIPQRVCGVVSGPDRQLLWVRDGQIGRADHPAPGIPARCRR